MGANKSGVIWNDSDFDIKYYLASQIPQSIGTHHIHQLNPQLQINIKGNLKIGGWKRITETSQNYTQNIQSYEALAGRINTTGLGSLEMGKYYITVKAVIGKYEKLLIGNCPVRTIKDARYKIRQDLSYRQIEQKQAIKLISQSTVGTQDNEKSVFKVSPQRQTRRKEYIEQLKAQSLGYNEFSTSPTKTS